VTGPLEEPLTEAGKLERALRLTLQRKNLLKLDRKLKQEQLLKLKRKRKLMLQLLKVNDGD